ncbi:MAG: hypothetical protein AABZ74_02050 [Cyanobacteriota bacterium]
MDFEDIFNECAAEPQNNIKTPESFNFAQKIISEVEAQYTGKNTDLIDRQKEIDDLRKDINDSKDAIKRIKMPKGAGTAKMREMLSKQVSDKRTGLRNRIKRAEIRLDEIDVETNGQLSKEKEAAVKKMEELKKESRSGHQKELSEKYGGEWGSQNPYGDF